MIKSIINTKNTKDADVVILSAPYEKTASSRKGTINGPKAIVKCLEEKLEFFDRQFKVETIDFVKIAHEELKNISKLSPEKAVQKIKDKTLNLLNQNKFVFLFGGEHSVSIGVFDALKEKYNPKDVTILHIDAHCDLRDSDADYSKKPTKFAHSAVMRRASEFGFNLVQVGIRTYDKTEYAYFSDPENNVRVFEWKRKIPEISEILESIKTKYIYISVDVDGFDPSFMPGTGTPVQGGLDWWYGLELIERAIYEKELIGADIVEVSPQKDSVLTEYGAAQIFYSVITHKFKNRF
ncbi:MAG TPA: agmatinase [Candidatus Paceibacterota bacterium]|nr:agmatinase [Candidatus Paceibacterota bacterium]